MQQHTDIVLRAVPAFLILMIAEAVFLIKEHGFDKHSKDLPVSTILRAGFIIISFFSKAMLLLIYQVIYAHRIYTLPANGLVIWVACFIADDFTAYQKFKLIYIQPTN